jgi:hypothetical protein
LSLSGELEARIQDAVAERAAELGSELAPPDVTVETLPEDTVPRVVVFRGRYRDRDSRGAITGIVEGAGEPNTYPNDALVTVWKTWIAASGGLPDAASVASVSAYILGGAGPYEVVLDDAADAPATAPRLIDEGTPGVVFWWERRDGLVETTLRLQGDMIDIAERRAGEE